MSTIKVDTYLTRGGASEIAIDKLKGVTAAGSMLVVGEGGTNTTNLQQGLGKGWLNFNGTGTIAITDSFNIASITDNATGDYTNTLSNAMANSNFCYTALGGNTSGALSVRIENANNRSTTTIDILSYNTSSQTTDFADMNTLFHGDLA
jgi:hypothetical protein